MADAQARQHGPRKLSLIVFDKNVGAKRLYERHGHTETAGESVVPHPLIHMDGDALLMVQHLEA